MLHVLKARSGGVRDKLRIERGARSLGCIALKMPQILRIDKVVWTNEIRACHVSKLLVLTTTFQGIQSNPWLAEGVEVRSRCIWIICLVVAALSVSRILDSMARNLRSRANPAYSRW